VGFHTSDDAGIYKLSDDMAIVVTADYITPPVDDGFIFGKIAAANAISDVYAMGGRPLTCLNLVSFPSKKLPPDVLQQIVAGALETITAADAVLAGGHSIEDDEPKFGLAVTGLVHPQRYWTNSNARPGDVLVLTKPLGSGVIFNANLKQWVSAAALDACIATLCELNRAAAETLRDFEVHAATDVTGFGLAGHGYEVAKGSGVGLEIDLEALPVMVEALEMYRKGVNTGVNSHNREMVNAQLRFTRDWPRWHQEILFDPQTSGGLLVSLPRAQGTEAVERLHQNSVDQARIIGRVTALEDNPYLTIV
jgi:selenide,water dikinase